MYIEFNVYGIYVMQQVDFSLSLGQVLVCMV